MKLKVRFISAEIVIFLSSSKDLEIMETTSKQQLCPKTSIKS